MAQPQQVREACEQDIDALSDVGKATFTEAFGHYYSKENLEQFLESNHAPSAYRELLGQAQTKVWVAEKGGVVIGYCVAAPCKLPIENMPPDAGELKRLYVLAAGQGTGLGTQMLEQALTWMKQSFSDLYISVYAENYGAKRLYERHGFAVVGHYHFMVGDHADPELILKWSSGERVRG